MDNLHDIYKNWTSPDGHGDKGTAHSYIDVYDRLLEHYRHKANILEIGLAYGQSLEMWYEYFGKGSKIYGIDIKDDEIGPYLDDNRFKITIGDATNQDILKHFPRNKFDIIIDDGSHKLGDQIKTFNLFSSKMRNGGVYIIEDIVDIDNNRKVFEALGPEAVIVDKRHIKNRHDDVMVIYYF